MTHTREHLEEEQVREERLTTADVSQATTSATRTEKPAETETARIPLMPGDSLSGFRERWNKTQASFVDEPRHAVEEADSLVAEVMQSLAKTFAGERQNLEGQWGRGDNVSTEDLRIALQRYRSFFSRLLSV